MWWKPTFVPPTTGPFVVDYRWFAIGVRVEIDCVNGEAMPIAPHFVRPLPSEYVFEPYILWIS